MRIAIEHITRYRYDEEASYSVQALRLTPASYEGMRVLDWQVSAEPVFDATPTRDGFGNLIHLMTVSVPHREISIRASGTVEVEDRSGVVIGIADPVPQRVYLRRTALTEPSDAIARLVEQTKGQAPIPRLHALMAAIRERVEYRIGATHAATTAAEALAAGQGVCQDHAHIFISACRAGGIPARYVTGYLLMPGAGETADAHHAWAEAWVDGLGWVGFDVANLLCPTDHYVRMAAALDAHYAAPIRGSRRGGETEALRVEVVVQQQQQQVGGQQ